MNVRRAFGLVAAGALLLAACGDDSDGGASSEGTDETGSTLPPADTPATVEDLSGRTFVSTDVEGYELVADSTITMSFDGDQLSVNAGCNTIAGTYTIEAGEFAGGPFAMTEMACEPDLMAQDEWLVDVLSTGPGMRLVGETLTIDALDGAVLTMTDREVAQPDLPIEGTRWIVTSMMDADAVRTVPVDVESSLQIEDGTATIDTGCNAGTTTVAVTDTTLTFEQMAVTLVMCEEDANLVQDAVLNTLTGEVDYTIEADQLTLQRTDDTGATFGLVYTAES